MQEDRTKKVIRINVTVPTYYSLDIDQRVSFEISNGELFRYGNTSNAHKNLYEQSKMNKAK